MKKTLFEQEVDFNLPISEISIPLVGDVTVTTRIHDGVIWAKFSRYSPSTYIETTIENWLTGIRLQYIVQDALVRKTVSTKQ